jgi:hypothetical protein
MTDLMRRVSAYYDASYPPDILVPPELAPAAVLTTLNPASIIVATPTLCIVNGTGFVPASRVWADEEVQTTTYVSDTQLQYTAQADLAGTQDITVTVNAHGDNRSNGLILNVTATAEDQPAEEPTDEPPPDDDTGSPAA